VARGGIEPPTQGFSGLVLLLGIYLKRVGNNSEKSLFILIFQNASSEGNVGQRPLSSKSELVIIYHQL